MLDELGAAIVKITPTWDEFRTFMKEEGSGWTVAAFMFYGQLKAKAQEGKSEKVKQTMLENISKLVTDESSKIKGVLDAMQELSYDIREGIRQKDSMMGTILELVKELSGRPKKKDGEGEWRS